MALKDEFRGLIEKALIPLITGHDQHICLLDVPDYPNVGDHLITLGELALLETAFPRAKCSFFDLSTYSAQCDPLIEQCSILLLQGGGNFGDIWPRHQQFRERIIRRFAHKRIIQLPQSISFSVPANIQSCAAIIADARDFHLFTRDTTSEAFARQHFDCPVYMVPDMAFCMPDLARLPASVEIMCLLRADKEAVADHAAIKDIVAADAATHAVDDWNEAAPSHTRRIDDMLARITRSRPRVTWPVNRWMLRVRKRHAQQRLRIGISLLSAGRIVVTDRLHAHVLSCLLGIPHVVFNSLDGKVAAMYRTWTYREPLATLLETPAELGDALKRVRS